MPARSRAVPCSAVFLVFRAPESEPLCSALVICNGPKQLAGLQRGHDPLDYFIFLLLLSLAPGAPDAQPPGVQGEDELVPFPAASLPGPLTGYRQAQQILDVAAIPVALE